MPVQKIKKQSSAKSNKWRKRLLITATAILALILGAIAFDVYSQVQFRKTVVAEKAQFDEIFGKIVDINKNIVKKHNRIDRQVADKSCSQPYMEVGVAPITCRVEIVLSYSLVNAKEANELSNDAQKLYIDSFSMVQENPSSNLSSSEFHLNNEDEVQSKQYRLRESTSQIPCTATHSLKKNNSTEFEIALTCSKQVDSAIYNLESN